MNQRTMGCLTEIIKGLQGLLADTSAFLNPLATPVNLMVMGPAGYQFGDCRKLGLPLMLWFFIVAIFLVPLIWPLKP